MACAMMWAAVWRMTCRDVYKRQVQGIILQPCLVAQGEGIVVIREVIAAAVQALAGLAPGRIGGAQHLDLCLAFLDQFGDHQRQEILTLERVGPVSYTHLGGGKPGICQGSCAATPEQVEDFLKENIDHENAL